MTSWEVVFVYGGIAPLAVGFGIWMARRQFRDDTSYIIKGKCPNCRSTNLINVPMNATTILTTCGQCENQYISQSDQEVTSIGRRAYIPPISLTLVHDMMEFRIAGGMARFDTADIKLLDGYDHCSRPREVLTLIASKGIRPNQCRVETPTEDAWETFVESAGLDIPFAQKDQ